MAQNKLLEKILIVTYTEKAVGELRDRIRKELAGDEKTKKIDVDVDNASIFTIHSFCQKTLGEFSFTARQSSNLELVSEGEIGDFIDLWIRDKIKNDKEKYEDFKNLFENTEKQSTFINSLKEDIASAVEKYYLDKNGEEDSSIVSYLS